MYGRSKDIGIGVPSSICGGSLLSDASVIYCSVTFVIYWSGCCCTTVVPAALIVLSRLSRIDCLSSFLSASVNFSDLNLELIAAVVSQIWITIVYHFLNIFFGQNFLKFSYGFRITFFFLAIVFWTCNKCNTQCTGKQYSNNSVFHTVPPSLPVPRKHHFSFILSRRT